MTPEALAEIHAAAFAHSRGWHAAEIADLLAQPHTDLFHRTGGFAITRTLAGESELLTLAVAPDHQRKGIAKSLLQRWLAQIAPQADSAFLEVAADNSAALALYSGLAFAPTGLRKGYYTRADAAPIDAIVMARDLPSL
ncbi:GNAT family N-acetyltransferase [uncultured Sulfitobacter sp.]|uniref:GNAT family N-acetyltransferase n=1 Tax=uncultured Sulfitobacter sp. TaxID=191468 RepID=UPI00260385C6|nr:GNAT family N-acetyltransferase [uncultured Sulfitobacter sp.]